MSKRLKVRRFDAFRNRRNDDLPALYSDYVALGHNLVQCFESMYRRGDRAADMEHVLSCAAYAMRQAKNVRFQILTKMDKQLQHLQTGDVLK